MMYLVKFTNMEVEEFNAEDFEDLMQLLVEYIGEDTTLFMKTIEGFKNDFDKELQYIKMFNRLFRYSNEEITKIYEINQYFES